MRPKQLFAMAVVICALAGACTNARKETPAATDLDKIKLIVEEIQIHPDRWTTYRDGLIRQYKQLGHDVAIDSSREFLTLLAGFAMFTVPMPEKAPFKPEERMRAFADFVRLNNNLPLPFSSEAWKAAEGDYKDSLRYRLFKGFQRENKIIGMQADELIGKLGPPLWSTPAEVVYEMGPGTGVISIDDMSLYFAISSGTVTGYRYHQN